MLYVSEFNSKTLYFFTATYLTVKFNADSI